MLAIFGARGADVTALATKVDVRLPAPFARTSKYLTHPVFQSLLVTRATPGRSVAISAALRGAPRLALVADGGEEAEEIARICFINKRSHYSPSCPYVQCFRASGLKR
mgnify:CR=1 FL=1